MRAFRPIVLLALRSLQQGGQSALAMMLFLAVDVSRDLVQLVFAQRQDSVAFLPLEFHSEGQVTVHTEGRCALDLADERAERDRRRKAEQQMGVIRHGVVPNRPTAALLHFVVKDFQELRSPCSVNQRSATTRGPREVVIQLMEAVRHSCTVMGAEAVEGKPLKGLDFNSMPPAPSSQA